MFRSSQICLFPALLFLLLPAAALCAGDAEEHVRVLDNVVAVVDGEPVTASELRAYIDERGSSDLDQSAGQSGSSERKLLEDMLLVRMLEREAREIGVAVAEQEIDAYVEQIQRQNGVDEDGLTQLLGSQGLTLKQYRRQVRTDILRARVLALRVGNKINIVDEDINAFLEDNPGRLPESGGVHIEQLVFKFESADDRETAAGAARQAAEALASGADARRVAPERFLDLGLVEPDDLRSEFRRAIEGVADGAVAPVVETQDAFYVLRVKGRAESKEEIRKLFADQIKAELHERRFREASEKYLNESLPEKYNIEVKL